MPEPVSAVVSCGVLVMSRQGQLLLGHATGVPHWDIPKGVGEPGESPRETAVREAAEETGLKLAAPHLLELGRYDYRADKSLHLFATLFEQADAGNLACTSLFRDVHGRWRPEFDRFRWAGFDDVPRLCARNMARVLTQSVDLAAVHARLLEAPAH